MKVANWKDLPEIPFNETGMRQIFAGERVMLARHVMRPGFPEFLHSHPHEQIMYVLEGRCLFTVGDEKTEMGPGDMVHVPSGAPHDLSVVGDRPAVVIDVFSPVREDFIAQFGQPSEGRADESEKG